MKRVAILVLTALITLCMLTIRGLDELTILKAFEAPPHYHFIMMYDNPSLMSFCAIESLAAVTRKGIQVWMTHPPIPGHLAGAARSQAMDLYQVLSETPFENHAFTGRYARQNVANALRLAIIYKHGGVYMDTDFIFFRNLDDVTSGFAPQSSEQGSEVYNNAAFQFRKGSPFLRALMEDFVKQYNGHTWGQQGPLLFTRVYQRFCNGTTFSSMDCPRIWNAASVYNIHYSNVSLLFEQAEEGQATHTSGLQNAHALHTWNKLSGGREHEACLRSPPTYANTFIGRLRSLYCPKTFGLAIASNCSIVST